MIFDNAIATPAAAASICSPLPGGMARMGEKQHRRCGGPVGWMVGAHHHQGRPLQPKTVEKAHFCKSVKHVA